jgi:hypothetical protein
MFEPNLNHTPRQVRQVSPIEFETSDIARHVRGKTGLSYVYGPVKRTLLLVWLHNLTEKGGLGEARTIQLRVLSGRHACEKKAWGFWRLP